MLKPLRLGHVSMPASRCDGHQLAGQHRWLGSRAACQRIHPEFPVIYISGVSAADWPLKGVPNSIMLESPSQGPSLSQPSPSYSRGARQQRAENFKRQLACAVAVPMGYFLIRRAKHTRSVESERLGTVTMQRSGWRDLQSAKIEFTMKRLREPTTTSLGSRTLQA